ncbi:MAG: exo-alpha-sialidase, partial [Xanthomonadaceae bacterium]|nr:exo-alpha-sialidase [Xanthomonadaceae bacterium]
GDSLVVNESDPPQLAATRDGALWVHWSQKVGADVALQLSRSVDGGFNWSAPLQVASATPPVELGFATLWPQSRDSVGMVWLDGNAAVVARAAPAQAIAATTLRTAVFSANLQPGAVTAIDTRVCDCCHPAVAVTTRKPLLVYRDRTADEIRDIVATQFDGVHWSAPRPVHVDGWKMSGCPVNGPAVAANADEVVVAWYTSAGGEPSVQLARSSDAGDTFAPPVAIDHGNAVLGRVAVALDARQAWVLWLREDARAQSLWLARYTTDLSRQLGRIQVAALQGRGRITGFPQMVVQSGTAYVAWTDIDGGSTLLHGATITP